jgi:catechol 2,3-dioxygenase-like lactoylglutathione lyase family enzyme
MAPTTCSCCGEEKPTAGLRSRDDVQLCRDCLAWLLGQVSVTSTPTLPVRDLPDAVAFYERAGFGVRLYADETGDGGDGFAFVDYDGASVLDLDAVVGMVPSENRAGCYLIAHDADAWHGRLAAAGLPVTRIADQSWGMREFTLTDPSGNRVRIGRAIDDDPAGR